MSKEGGSIMQDRIKTASDENADDDEADERSIGNDDSTGMIGYDERIPS